MSEEQPNYIHISNELLNKKISGIYFLFKEKRLVYVGVSTNVYIRLHQHGIDGKDFDEIKYVEISIEQCPEVEFNLISLLKPLYNKSNKLYGFSNRVRLKEKKIYTCAYCGIEYESENPKIYHSNACKQKAYRDRRVELSSQRG